MNKKKIKAVLLYAPEWCRMSRNIWKPFLAECEKYKTKHEILDVEGKDGLAMSIKYGIRNVPAVLVFEGNELQDVAKGKDCIDIVKAFS